MPVGTITANYTAQVMALKLHAQGCAEGAVEVVGRHWFAPDAENFTWEGDPQDQAGVAAAFDRSQEADIYSEAISTRNGSVGDAMAMKVQHDYQALMERAYRARHMSPVRAALHAGARRKGHATTTFGAFDRVTQLVADFLVAGAAGWLPPQARE